MTDRFKIGELARRTHCQVETIRYYERIGVLPEPVRSDGNYRLYDERHIEWLSFIRHCRSLDMTLEEIRTLSAFRDAPEENCDGVNSLLDAHVTHVARRITELKALEKQLKKLRCLCSRANVAKDCGILNELATENLGTCLRKKEVVSHVPGGHTPGKSPGEGIK